MYEDKRMYYDKKMYDDNVCERKKIVLKIYVVQKKR